MLEIISDLWEDMIGKFVIVFIAIVLIVLSIFFIQLHYTESAKDISNKDAFGEAPRD